MMNHADRSMGGWSGGGMWVWSTGGVIVLVLIVAVIGRLLKK